MKVLILAAGYGTRLYPITKDTPKPLLWIDDSPLINYILGKIKKFDFIKEVFVVTNDKFYTNFKEWHSCLNEPFKKLSIKIINDGSTSVENRLGAMGDINFVIQKESVKDDILVIGGDNLFDEGLEKFIEFSQSLGKEATIGLFDIGNKKEASKFGVAGLDKDNKVISFEEKPRQPSSTLIAMCLYYFSYKTFEFISQYLKETVKHDTTGDYINWLHSIIPVYGFIFKGKWSDIGHIDSLCDWDEGYCKYKSNEA
ncbi:MAG: nucleotidyltransferase family protein [Candidatus Omnitrophota bacterium]|nr:nucleotidyltransferase family protein [Candidatus Omnitrophota bacterium]